MPVFPTGPGGREANHLHIHNYWIDHPVSRLTKSMWLQPSSLAWSPSLNALLFEETLFLCLA